MLGFGNNQLGRAEWGTTTMGVTSARGHWRNAQRRGTEVAALSRCRSRGFAIVWVAIFLLLMLLIVGLSLDTAKVAIVAHQLQNAADAGALAGAQHVKFDEVAARQSAITVAAGNLADSVPVTVLDNPSNDPNGDVVLGRYFRQSRTFEPNLAKANAVKVVTRRIEGGPDGPVPLAFGSIADVNTVGAWRYAIAIGLGSGGAGLIALAPDGTGLRITGSVLVDVNDGDIQVNSELEARKWAVLVDGGSFNSGCDELNVCGLVDPGFDWTSVDYPVNQHALPIPDPLGHLDQPAPPLPPLTSWGSDTVIYDPNTMVGPQVLQPGYYPGGFSLSGGTWILEPGFYALGGGSSGGGNPPGLVIGGSTIFTGDNVQFFVTASDTGVYGQVDIGGSPVLHITPPGHPDIIDGTPGVSIWQDRNNTNEARIIGTSDFDLQGTLYFPTCPVELGGDGFEAGNQLITYRLWIHGNGRIGINYDGRNRNCSYKSMLVE
ncbi:MAG: hypothetical protein JSU70_09335 [Phycisphaerales bacterium]|nr:MAG: hypothetical protein JSU70_09335 [Phycisphaerales bacterium]